MKKIDKVRAEYKEQLKLHCENVDIPFESVLKLLEAEKTKKLLRRTGLMQQNIDKEIHNALKYEN